MKSNVINKVKGTKNVLKISAAALMGAVMMSVGGNNLIAMKPASSMSAASSEEGQVKIEGKGMLKHSVDAFGVHTLTLEYDDGHDEWVKFVASEDFDLEFMISQHIKNSDGNLYSSLLNKSRYVRIVEVPANVKIGIGYVLVYTQDTANRMSTVTMTTVNGYGYFSSKHSVRFKPQPGFDYNVLFDKVCKNKSVRMNRFDLNLFMAGLTDPSVTDVQSLDPDTIILPGVGVVVCRKDEEINCLTLNVTYLDEKAGDQHETLEMMEGFDFDSFKEKLIASCNSGRSIDKFLEDDQLCVRKVDCVENRGVRREWVFKLIDMGDNVYIAQHINLKENKKIQVEVKSGRPLRAHLFAELGSYCFLDEAHFENCVKKIIEWM